ncbi:winged helix-turn-helix domain-containing protein [Paraburkholderia sediminicola]|uniref:ATP-binding protein n=1 Tax=Paraburkholderia sediminicola TaxID=458836 RepID=UPI0038B75128
MGKSYTPRDAIMLTVSDVEIIPDQRRVLVSSKPFNLGSRAYDLLEMLADARGELVSKTEMMKHVWPNTVVVENNLHVHIAAIRKMLGSRAELLVAVPGRGYRLAMEFPRRRPLEATPSRSPGSGSLSNLPSTGSSLFGRESAISDGVRICTQTRVVSMVGPGGIGKTRLAIEVARQLLPAYNDGVWMVELSKIGKPEFLAAEIAALFDPAAPMEREPMETIANALDGKRMLILLDNCEHLIEAAADVAQAIATHAASCTVLATSREPLRVPGEAVYRVPALDFPREDDGEPAARESSAVQLFLNRASSIDARFSDDAENILLAAVICRRLDGMPLAIELAASRAVTLGIRRLVSNLSDRFMLLNGGYRTALPQHQTLKAMFDWSYNLLPEKQRTVFRRLGVFPSSFELEAATDVLSDERLTSSDVLQIVGTLTDKSLLVADRSNGITVYSMLETCRAYALEKLDDNGERDRLEARFVSYVQSRLRSTLASIYSAASTEPLRLLQPDLDNIRFSLNCLQKKHCNWLLGTELIAMTAPLFFSLGLASEIRLYARSVLEMGEKSEQTEEISEFCQRLLGTIAGRNAGESANSDLIFDSESVNQQFSNTGFPPRHVTEPSN